MMGMSKGGMSKLIDRLVKKGYVAKEVQEHDRRFRGVWLTKHGRTCVPLIASKEKSADRAFFGPLKGSGRYRLTQSLKKLLTGRRRDQMKEWVSLHGMLNLPQRTMIPASPTLIPGGPMRKRSTTTANRCNGRRCARQSGNPARNDGNRPYGNITDPSG